MERAFSTDSAFSSQGGDDADKNLWVKFFMNPVQNNFKSEKEGRPIYDEKLFISIIIPGTPNKTERPARDEDKARFPKQWANFQAGQNEKVDGMPLEEWPQMTRALVDELRYKGFRSVEQIANASDAQMQGVGMGGGLGLRDKAKAFLALAKDTAAGQKFAAENEALKSQIADLQTQISQLNQQFLKSQKPVTAEAPKRRGRPPKAQTEGEQS